MSAALAPIADALLGRRFGLLVCRPDRLGDVILSTPVIQALRAQYPEAVIHLMVREAVAPLFRNLPGVDRVVTYDPDGRHRGLRGLFVLIREIRALELRVSVCLHSRWKLAAALYAAGVRYRLGPLSKPHSWLFYNRGVRQNRSRVEMHEADYNLQLLRRLGVRSVSRQFTPQVAVPPAALAAAGQWLKQAFGERSASLVVVHPGMGGSALNWPVEHYAELIRALAHEGRRVVVSVGPQDIAAAAALRAQGLADGSVPNCVWWEAASPAALALAQSAGIAPLTLWAAILAQAELVVAPSTGPLHLAAALGRRVLTFYPPIRVQSANRWGPYVMRDDETGVLVPDVYCGQDFRCIGSLCNYYPCMSRLTVAQALDEAKRLSPSTGGAGPDAPETPSPRERALP